MNEYLLILRSHYYLIKTFFFVVNVVYSIDEYKHIVKITEIISLMSLTPFWLLEKTDSKRRKFHSSESNAKTKIFPSHTYIKVKNMFNFQFSS